MTFLHFCKSCSDILITVLKFVFDLSLSQRVFPTRWKQSAVALVFKKGKTAFVNNYRPISILSTSCEIFEIFILEHVSHHLQSKFIHHRHGFTKSKSTSTNLVASRDYFTSLLYSQRQTHSTYYDFSNAID